MVFAHPKAHDPGRKRRAPAGADQAGDGVLHHHTQRSRAHDAARKQPSEHGTGGVSGPNVDRCAVLSVLCGLAGLDLEEVNVPVDTFAILLTVKNGCRAEGKIKTSKV